MSASVLFDAPGPRAKRRYAILGAVGGLVFAAVMAVVIWKLADKDQFASTKWKPFAEWSTWKNYILPGLRGTLIAAVLAIVISLVLGAALAMLRLIEVPKRKGPAAVAVRALRWVVTAWVELTRALPVLLMMLFIFGWLSAHGQGSGSGPLIATVAGLVFYNSSVICEVIRSGVDQLPSGQREAGSSIGLSAGQTVRIILLPQAITAMLPSLISQVIVVLKDTALGYNVLYGELLYKSKPATSLNGNIFAMLIVLAVIYIVINYAISKLATWVERRLQARGRKVAPAGAAGDPGGPGNAPGVVAGGGI
ncbi:glutamate ABC transporter permease [Flexivirga endophytica]|uniref:Glutamate ABC transporter permease n=1 Tax=Flexivirga endophytica TaxID=1849103 RepID=A0A916WY30_9MICO|nr:amino acid ABC transporter permease [Flexivirga endophytica]GGB41398.1 glutamate ABC transporter permease [Flexivirga endophytica]GHB49238.1 glutamate ABC transporter permease [Flexivirga endophytica]